VEVSGMVFDLACGRAEEVLEKMEAGTVDLVFTSPPYKDEDGFSLDLMARIARGLFRVVRDGGQVFVNFGHLASDKLRPFRVALAFEDAGWYPVDTVTWVKNHFKPIQGRTRVNNLSEFVFHFARGRNYTLDRLAAGVPYVDESNASRWKGANGQNLRCGGNVWFIPYPTITRKRDRVHKYEFPVELPTRGIRLAGIPKGSLVLDPFMGAAGTGVAALQEGMDFAGVDQDPGCLAAARGRLIEAGGQEIGGQEAGTAAVPVEGLGDFFG